MKECKSQIKKSNTLKPSLHIPLKEVLSPETKEVLLPKSPTFSEVVTFREENSKINCDDHKRKSKSML
jgi:hypothetical protein